MAHDAPTDAQGRQDQSQGRSLPDAPRPRAEVWRDLRDEGIQWEGQVLLVGAGTDLPAFLVLTSERLVIASNGDVALEAPRHWLTPEPRLVAGNGVRLSITPVDAGRGEATSLILRVRGGRGSAARLVGAISGRLVSARTQPRPVPDPDGQGDWGGSVGAASPVALPPLPETPSAPVARRAWPPVEQNAVEPPPPPVSTRGTAPASIASWTAANLDTWPQQGTPTGEAPAAYQAPPPVPPKRRRGRRVIGWGFRAVILALLIGAGLTYGRDYLPRNLEIPLPAPLEERLGIADDDPTDVAQVPDDQVGTSPEPTTPSSDGTSGANNSDSIGTRDDSEDAVGGTNGEITPADIGQGMLDNPPSTEAPTPTPEPTSEPVVEVQPTDEPTVESSIFEPTIEPTDVPVIVEPTEAPATEAPTEVPVTETPTDEATAEPTEIPATEAPATEVPVTEAPTEAPPTEEPVTEEPTISPATEEPTAAATEEPATEAPTVEPTEQPVATLESQPPSVNPEIPPAQSMVSGEFRFDITGASRGESIAELPELQPVGVYGEWLVLSVFGENTSTTEQVFDMNQFRVVADGSEYLLDVGNAWVGGLLGYTPAYGNTDAILWASGEGHEFALTFLVPPGTESLQLIAGDQVIDLTSTLSSEAAVGSESTDSVLPGAIEATVVDVIDAETIVIEVDGITQTVRYLGIDVPGGDDCFAAEAAAANADLVEGQTVRIERQATDLDARGNWVRDVWVPDAGGAWTLASHALVRAGMAEAAPSDPNTRFAGWLTGAQQAAQADGAGLWGACANETSTDALQVATVPDRARMSAWRKPRMQA